MGKNSKSPSKTKGANLTLKQKEDFRNAVDISLSSLRRRPGLSAGSGEADRVFRNPRETHAVGKYGRLLQSPAPVA